MDTLPIVSDMPWSSKRAKRRSESGLGRTRMWLWGVLFIAVLGSLLAPLPAAAQADDMRDDLIYDRVMRQLVNDPDLKTNALAVEVEQRVVTVTGKVETEKLRKRVEKVVKKVKGVKKVVNNVEVRR